MYVQEPQCALRHTHSLLVLACVRVNGDRIANIAQKEQTFPVAAAVQPCIVHFVNETLFYVDKYYNY